MTYMQQWRKEHREQILEDNRQWREHNREAHLERRLKSSYTVAYKFATLRARCKRLGMLMTIPRDIFTEIISMPCEYCGGSLPKAGYGLDRKDNSLGYTSENSVPCCTRCNTMKGALLTYEEMKLIWNMRLGDCPKRIVCQNKIS